MYTPIPKALIDKVISSYPGSISTIITEDKEIKAREREGFKNEIKVLPISIGEGILKVSGSVGINFGSRHVPAFGFMEGIANEESLLCCACNLYNSLKLVSGYYGKNASNNDCILTENVKFFKEWSDHAIITCEASDEISACTNVEDYDCAKIKQKVRRVLDIASNSGYKAVVIGVEAICSNKSNSAIIAKAIKEELYGFDKIVIAAFNEMGECYKTFNKILKGE